VILILPVAVAVAVPVSVSTTVPIAVAAALVKVELPVPRFANVPRELARLGEAGVAVGPLVAALRSVAVAALRFFAVATAEAIAVLLAPSRLNSAAGARASFLPPDELPLLPDWPPDRDPPEPFPPPFLSAMKALPVREPAPEMAPSDEPRSIEPRSISMRLVERGV